MKDRMISFGWRYARVHMCGQGVHTQYHFKTQRVWLSSVFFFFWSIFQWPSCFEQFNSVLRCGGVESSTIHECIKWLRLQTVTSNHPEYRPTIRRFIQTWTIFFAFYAVKLYYLKTFIITREYPVPPSPVPSAFDQETQLCKPISKKRMRSAQFA